MTTTYLQGTVLEFEKIIQHGDTLIYLKGGSITEGDDVGLMFEHTGRKWGRDDLELHISESGVAFRYALPDSWVDEFKDQTDEIETYLGVSAGLTVTQSESLEIDGEKVQVVTAAELTEISLLSSEPAVKSSYARIVSADTCGELSADVSAGRLELVGRVIGLHRRAKAAADGGPVKYSSSPSEYERAASKFERALLRLA